MTQFVNKNSWLLKQPAVLYHPEVIYLKGDKENQAYRNYCVMRWGREPEFGSEMPNFFSTHPNADIALFENSYGKFYCVTFNKK